MRTLALVMGAVLVGSWPSGEEAGAEEECMEVRPLGVVAHTLTSEEAKLRGTIVERGALVSEVAPRTPASRGGLRRGDVIIRIENQPVADPCALADAIEALPRGFAADVEFVRGGITRQTAVVVPASPDAKPAASRASGRH
ncbi:MAG: PDZ domain-containing protein [Deltaproteobacteria bacterium]|nr:PDZ domain-containing protein [Deltaproteobacteria bacterium]